MKEGGSGALGCDFLITFHNELKGQWREQFHYCFEEEVERKTKEGGSGALGSNFLIGVHNKLKGKWRDQFSDCFS